MSIDTSRSVSVKEAWRQADYGEARDEKLAAGKDEVESFLTSGSTS